MKILHDKKQIKAYIRDPGHLYKAAKIIKRYIDEYGYKIDDHDYSYVFEAGIGFMEAYNNGTFLGHAIIGDFNMEQDLFKAALDIETHDLGHDNFVPWFGNNILYNGNDSKWGVFNEKKGDRVIYDGKTARVIGISDCILYRDEYHAKMFNNGILDITNL